MILELDCIVAIEIDSVVEIDDIISFLTVGILLDVLITLT
jgi:hypothetical protein